MFFQGKLAIILTLLNHDKVASGFGEYFECFLETFIDSKLFCSYLWNILSKWWIHEWWICWCLGKVQIWLPWIDKVHYLYLGQICFWGKWNHKNANNSVLIKFSTEKFQSTLDLLQWCHWFRRRFRINLQ